MLTRIAIVSIADQELEKIRCAIRNPIKFTVREFLSMEACARDLNSFPMEILLIRAPVFEEKHVAVITKALRHFRKASVIFLAREIRPAARLKTKDLIKFKLLQEPLEVTDLVSIIDKMRTHKSSFPRLHPRARRKDPVQVIDSLGRSHRGFFIDFAQMGARLSVPSLRKFTDCESVQLLYESSAEPGKRHHIEAKIVWSKFGVGLVDHFMGVRQQITGIRFIAAY